MTPMENESGPIETNQTEYSIGDLSMEQFMNYKHVNKTILPEIANIVKNTDYVDYRNKHRSSKSKYWKHNDNSRPSLDKPIDKPGGKPVNWLLNKKVNQTDDEKLYTNFRSILNKISDSNLEELFEELINLDIINAQHLEKLVDFLFIKAISEQKFITTYAKLSKLLSVLYINIDEDDKIYFRTLLINKCQYMFTNAVSLEEPLENLDNSNAIFKFKNHVLGCVEYIGELYNQELLSDRIITCCFGLLFTKGANKIYTIDILCTLIKTIGANFFKKCPTEANQTFENINQLKDEPTINTKDKFAIMDILDLKKKQNW